MIAMEVKTKHYDELSGLKNHELVDIYKSVEFIYLNKPVHGVERTAAYQRGLAAIDILKTRVGTDLVNELISVPKPKTRLDRIKNFFFRKR